MAAKKRVFKRGIDAYKQQCAGGGKLIESAREIMEDPLYVYPQTLGDIANQEVKKEAHGLAALIVARARTADNTKMFPKDSDRQEGIEQLLMVPPELVTDVAKEILDAYGDLSEGPDADGNVAQPVAIIEEPAIDVTAHTPSVAVAEGN